ncbi:hypothetical protein NQ315_000614 [Exocentrus adspersus]|uniref:Uncharacterized protein n=1 Tax=Exocentrus adspersus TaxID=1586481 RepID=A0AAV8VP10_9CUCU|nr:hypothetical protein NQ315_000614 [Exocentrus adspersus]
MKINDIEDLGHFILIPKRTFPEILQLLENTAKFLKNMLHFDPQMFIKGKCTKQVFGLNKFSTIAKNVAIMRHIESSVEVSVSESQQNIELEMPSTSAAPPFSALSNSNNKPLGHLDAKTMPSISFENCSNITINLFANEK